MDYLNAANSTLSNLQSTLNSTGGLYKNITGQPQAQVLSPHPAVQGQPGQYVYNPYSAFNNQMPPAFQFRENFMDPNPYGYWWVIIILLVVLFAMIYAKKKNMMPASPLISF